MSASNKVRTVVAAALIAGTAALLPSVADARAGRGFHGGGFHGGGHVVVRSYFSPYFGFGYGWGPYWGYPYGPYGPYAYGPEGGVDMNAAMMAGYGAIDLNVKPNRAEVWVDGKFVGEARDLDGSPSYLWLKDGTHQVVISKGGYVNFDAKVNVLRGVKKELKVRLQEGPSEASRGEMGASR